MLSSVAGIIDPYGGLRVVVAHKNTFHQHLRPDEQLFIVPNFKVLEPVPWEKIPAVIKRVEDYVAWWIKTRNDPDDLRSEAIVMYKLRCLRRYHKFVQLTDIVET